jgi:hypothetical protein
MGSWQTSHVYFYSVSEAAIFITAFGLTEFAVGTRDYLPTNTYGWGVMPNPIARPRGFSPAPYGARLADLLAGNVELHAWCGR